jgi:hypothetical protein
MWEVMKYNESNAAFRYSEEEFASARNAERLGVKANQLRADRGPCVDIHEKGSGKREFFGTCPV